MRRSICAAALSLAAFVPCALSAQDSLRVLRLQPQSPATPIAPVVVMFDHPVAPRLDQSVDPKRVLRIVPAVGTRMYWRDPSTIVAEFDSVWAAGANYEVRLNQRLRSADGLPLAATSPFRVHVEMPRVLGLAPSSGGDVDTVVRPLVVYSGAFDPSILQGHAWFVPDRGCASSDSLPLTPTAIRRVSSADPWQIRDGTRERDVRLDSLRRVVELRVPGFVARGCSAELHVPLVIGQPAPLRDLFWVRRAFELYSIMCSRGCVRGQVTFDFSQPVSPEEVRAHIRVNGRPVRYSSSRPATSIVLPGVVGTRQTVRVSVDAALADTSGDRFGHDTTVVFTGLRLDAGVGFRSGVLMSPPDAPLLLNVRHVNTDSITVVIGRVVDSVRATALMNSDFGGMWASVLWASVVSDTVVRTIPSIAPEDSERVITLPPSLVPEAWRSEPLLLVRVQPTEVVKPSVIPERMPNIVRPPVGSEGTTPRFAVLQRSNIAAHAWTIDDRTEVWVTTLRDAQPRSGATVRLFDDSLRVIATGIPTSAGE